MSEVLNYMGAKRQALPLVCVVSASSLVYLKLLMLTPVMLPVGGAYVNEVVRLGPDAIGTARYVVLLAGVGAFVASMFCWRQRAQLCLSVMGSVLAAVSLVLCNGLGNSVFELFDVVMLGLFIPGVCWIAERRSRAG
jgi:hypothetical protein